MKLSSLLSKISAATSALALTLAFVVSNSSATFLAIAAVAFVGLIAVSDYAPRTRRWQPAINARRASSSRSTQHMRLAA